MTEDISWSSAFLLSLGTLTIAFFGLCAFLVLLIIIEWVGKK